MSAFEAPTINDFLDRLRMQTERAIRDFQRSKSQLDAMAAKAGALQSSRRVLVILDAIDEHVEKGVATLLGELRRALRDPDLDPLELRSLIGPRLDELTSGIISAAALERVTQSLQSGQVRELVATRTDKVRSNVRYWLRQFDIGWDEPVLPEALSQPPDAR